MLNLTGFKENDPVKVGPSVADHVAGIYLMVGVGTVSYTHLAGDLAAKGYDVTVFESLHKPGGVLAYGIPEFRLPKSIVAAEVEKLEKRGVTFVTNAIIGKAETVDDLMDDGYKAVFVGTGAGLPSFMNIPGENLLGVCSANEYLTRINLMKGYLLSLIHI